MEKGVEPGVRYNFEIPNGTEPTFRQFYSFVYGSLENFDDRDPREREVHSIHAILQSLPHGRRKSISIKGLKEYGGNKVLTVSVGSSYELIIGVVGSNGTLEGGHVLFTKKRDVLRERSIDGKVVEDSSDSGLSAKVLEVILGNPWGVKFVSSY